MPWSSYRGFKFIFCEMTVCICFFCCNFYHPQKLNYFIRSFALTFFLSIVVLKKLFYSFNSSYHRKLVWRYILHSFKITVTFINLRAPHQYMYLPESLYMLLVRARSRSTGGCPRTLLSCEDPDNDPTYVKIAMQKTKHFTGRVTIQIISRDN